MAKSQRQPRPEPWASYAPLPRLTVTFERGVNENTTPDIAECSAGYNFDLSINQTSFVARKAFDLKATAPNGLPLTGLLQLVKRDGSESTLTVNGDRVYLWNGASTFTSKATVISPAKLRSVYWSLGEYLVITDVSATNVVKTWDGVTFADIVTGLAKPLRAKYAIVQLNRIWLFNITYDGVSYPHMILASAFENPLSYDTSTRGGPSTVGGGTFATGLEAFFLLVPDMRPINGVCLFQNTLLISTMEGRLWNLTGTSAKDFGFVDFFDAEPSVGSECVTNIGNDVVFVSRGGEINNLMATQSFGNVRTYSLSRWIPQTTHDIVPRKIIYDQQNQRVLFFLPDQILVLFKDLLAVAGVEGVKSPWSFYRTVDPALFNTQDARYMYRPGTKEFTVFFGDALGRIYDLDGTGAVDAGLYGITVFRRTRHIGPDIMNKTPWPWVEENITGRIRYKRLSPIDATVTLEWENEYNQASTTVSMKGPGVLDVSPYWNGDSYWSGTDYWNGGFDATGQTTSININPGGKGPGFFMDISLTASSPFEVISVEFD